MIIISHLVQQRTCHRRHQSLLWTDDQPNLQRYCTWSPSSWSCLSRVAPVPAASLFVLEKWSLSGLQVSHCHLWLYSAPPSVTPPTWQVSSASNLGTHHPLISQQRLYLVRIGTKLAVLGQDFTRSKVFFLQTLAEI